MKEPENPHDNLAIAVRLFDPVSGESDCIGYVPRVSNISVGSLIRKQEYAGAEIVAVEKVNNGKNTSIKIELKFSSDVVPDVKYIDLSHNKIY